MTNAPEQPDDQANPQDENLEAQLDSLISDLEAVDPNSVPDDLRKQTEPDAPQPQPAFPEPVAADASDMTLPEPEPAPVAETPSGDGPTEASEPPQDQDLESIAAMAANLLDQQIDATIESATELTEPDPAAELEAEATTGAAADEGTLNARALSEADLGNQIDALLSNMQAQSAEAEASAQPAAAGPAPEPGPEAEPVEPPKQTPEPVASGAAETAVPDQDAGAVSIQQIDAMLAETAEQAIERDPEPAEHVPGTDEILAAQAEAERAEAEAKAGVETELGAMASDAADAPEPEPIPAQAPEPAEDVPEPALNQGASAADVARELDEDAEAAPASEAPASTDQAVTAMSDEQASRAQADGATAPTPEPESGVEADPVNEVVVNRSGLRKAEHALLVVCGKVNSPLNRLSSDTRHTVGLVSAVTAGLGLLLCLYGLVF